MKTKSRISSLDIFALKVMNMDATPSTSRILAMFDPTTLPSAMPGEPWMLATVETMSSGKDVPNAMMVNPTIIGERP